MKKKKLAEIFPTQYNMILTDRYYTMEIIYNTTLTLIVQKKTSRIENYFHAVCIQGVTCILDECNTFRSVQYFNYCATLVIF